MILEPEVLFAHRDQFIEHLEHDNLDGAFEIAPNLSSGRIAQVLSEQDNDIVIPFLEQFDEKQAADILIKLPTEMAAELFRLMEPDIAVRLLNSIPLDDAADILALFNETEGHPCSRRSTLRARK